MNEELWCPNHLDEHLQEIPLEADGVRKWLCDMCTGYWTEAGLIANHVVVDRDVPPSHAAGT